jgi:hypothetical protein
MSEELKPRDEVINRAIDLLSQLTKEDFHGYRSEIWSVLVEVYREGQTATRHTPEVPHSEPKRCHHFSMGGMIPTFHAPKGVPQAARCLLCGEQPTTDEIKGTIRIDYVSDTPEVTDEEIEKEAGQRYRGSSFDADCIRSAFIVGMKAMRSRIGGGK